MNNPITPTLTKEMIMKDSKPAKEEIEIAFLGEMGDVHEEEARIEEEEEERLGFWQEDD